MPPISEQVTKDLDKLVTDLPSTGKGALHITVTNTGAKVDVAQKWSTHFSSSAYWQKPRQGSAEWGARTTLQW